MTNDLHSHVLVHLLPNENTIGICTYQRGVGRNGRFLICRDPLREWLTGDPMCPFFDMDCGHVLCAMSDGENIDFRIYWLQHAYNNRLTGYEQFFSIPKQLLLNAFLNTAPVRHLFVPPTRKARISQQIKPEVMRRILSDPRTKRALSKAMRDCFHWSGEIVTLYHDGRSDFFFRTSSGCPTCGGLILHETTVKTLNGAFPKRYYSVHT